MENNEPVKRIEQPIDLSYIITERRLQTNAQFIEEIFEHISPEFKKVGIYKEGSKCVGEIYANREALDKYSVLKQIDIKF